MLLLLCRLTHREFINRYNISVMNGRPRTNDTPVQPSPYQTYESPRNSAVNRLKREDRRARRRKRSGYDHTASLCESILASIGYDVEEDKENAAASRVCPGFKLGRTKIFLNEDIVSCTLIIMVGESSSKARVGIAQYCNLMHASLLQPAI